MIQTKSVCAIGCLMSSVSMALNSLGKKIDGQEANPGTLNKFLKANGGYQANLFVWGAVSRFGLSYQGQPSSRSTVVSAVKAGIKKGGNIVILNVNNGGHWVLATGVNGSGYDVNDPGYSKTFYSFGEVLVAGIYKVQ